MRAMTARERRFVAVGILIGVVAIVFIAVVLPIFGVLAADTLARGDLRETYIHNQRVLAGIPVWREAAEKQKEDMDDYAIVAPTGALAAEQLKQRLTKLASDEGGTVQTISEIQGDVPDGWVKVRGDLTLTVAQLYKSLTKLESEAPYVVVGYLSVAADRAAKTGHAAPMDVRIEITAPVRIGQPA